jgi:hypothetical protein
MNLDNEEQSMLPDERNRAYKGGKGRQ